jgi:hypothetical protein
MHQPKMILWQPYLFVSFLSNSDHQLIGDLQANPISMQPLYIFEFLALVENICVPEDFP